ncbi:uncharacterized protein BDR25DRAFT_335881 [Lindgomyces ingoldianus]|uniref:Uncharacterized protein n=1 Tax=Lindgomyces ingoldianus TaxID=673940 RepID=A0ACB6QMQ5_9PLEO|nr:uncharacterized protein BDR25DRAFT_335881 [Lindgomyces ingoldianus]KAF2467436.1 hypothetical protein BDR25DRAFT_335881 [Lindgomyces ingoldianus]
MYFSTFISAATLFHLSIAGYVLEDDYMKDFYQQFDFFTAPDPTNGFVKYVDQATAQSSGLINATNSGAVSWGVDSTNKTPNGRPSIRLTSKKTYNSGLVVLDVAHMPTGCGTWPAFWMVGPSWPTNGEIDILEGVNEQETNAMTLHTGAGCSISSDAGAFAGEIATSNCDVNAANQDKNAGCSIKATSKNTYGAGLNANNGGVYATLWTDQAISVYFFPRGSIPADVTGDSPDPTTWGKPAAKFAGACDIPSIFKQQQIVFDTTFCGDWAGQVWSSGSCASKADTCNAFVQNNPSAFANAYWTINALKVYQDNGNGPAPSGPVSSVVPPVSSIVPPVSSVIPPVSSIIPPVSSIIPPVSSDLPSISVPIPKPTTLATVAVSTGDAPSTSAVGAQPTQVGPMGGFSFPHKQPSGASTIAASSATPSTPGKSTGAPAASSSAVASTVVPVPSASAPLNPGSSATVPTPSENTVAGVVSASSTPCTSTVAVPVVTDIISKKIVETVYQTVVVTVPYPGETPAPAARRARHVREHRRRHNPH